jgi:anti-sigma B factor antagonist
LNRRSTLTGLFCKITIRPGATASAEERRQAGRRFRGAAGQRPSTTAQDIWRRAAMQIEERVVDGVTILDLKGKMTLGEGDELLKDKINSLIQQDRKKLLLNLEGVPYIDSAGLGEIVRTYTTVSRQGGKLKLLNLTKRIQDLLAITKLLTVFETYESEPDAVKSFVG